MRSEAERPGGRSGKARASVHFSITKQMSAAIDMLLETGLYGFSRTDVARRLLAKALFEELCRAASLPKEKR